LVSKDIIPTERGETRLITGTIYTDKLFTAPR
jgi:hypothetical protein